VPARGYAMAMRTRFTHTVMVALLLAAGCQTARTAYYNAWEGMGYAKRERLADNVKAARTEQDEAKKQFASALEEFKSVTNYNGGELEPIYKKLKASYDECVSQAGDVNSKIASVKHVGDALFDEWQGEVGQIKDDDSLQKQSQVLLDKTKASYAEMTQRMDSAAATMQPVLTKFNNRVLFIKANLNAQAIASLKGTELDLGKDIDKLIKEMEASIAEADQFISEISTKKRFGGCRQTAIVLRCAQDDGARASLLSTPPPPHASCSHHLAPMPSAASAISSCPSSSADRPSDISPRRRSRSPAVTAE
jgi:hypothetical protein